MKTILKIEEAGMLLLSIFLFTQLNIDWWWYLVLFLVPDIGFVGYAMNPKVGALTYNILHHKGLAIGLYVLGFYLGNEPLEFAGLLVFGHAAFDRLLGYGLKYGDSFHQTHLGIIGKRYD